jgi:hypothetical protein
MRVKSTTLKKEGQMVSGNGKGVNGRICKQKAATNVAEFEF